MNRAPASVVLLAALALLGACSDGDKPPASKIENGISGDRGSAAFSSDQARCLAELYRDSDLSDEYLEALASGKPPKPSQDDLEALAELGPRAAAECPPRG